MHPLLRQLEDLCKADGRSHRSITEKAGVSQDTIARWLGRREIYNVTNGPSLILFEFVLNALGYELVIRRRGE
jgi:hypothetical protein